MILKKVGKLSFKLTILLIVLSGGFFIGLKNARAAENDIVLNEVMVDPAPTDTALCKSDSCEWLELYNKNNQNFDLKNWSIDGKKILTDINIAPNDYLIVTKNIVEFNKIWTVDQTKIIQLAIGLTNTGDSLTIISDTGNYTESFSWVASAGPNISWEKIDPGIESDSNWHESLVFGGTPGTKNSVTGIAPPNSPTLLSPFSGQNISSQDIQFNWSDPDPNLNYELILSQNNDLSLPVLDQTKILDTKIEIDDLDYGSYYWQIIASNGLYQTPSALNSFTIVEPSYCNLISISEIMPNPSGDQSGEWIELFNGSSDDVNLKGWALEDLDGATHKYTIADDLIIKANKYLVIFRSQSDITLNNDKDGVALYQPNGKILMQTPEFTSAANDYSWAEAPDNTWNWTTTPTPDATNKITAPDTPAPADPADVNSTPIEIPTADFRKYQGMLVKVRGEVVDTSGNTFYLDDGSGPVKIYIQDKTGISKPTMHQGDIFEIIGLVDLFGETNWRILPRTIDDIKLIESATKISLSSSAKASSTKTASTSTKTSTSNNSLIPSVKAAGTSNSDNQTSNSNNAKDSFFVQFIKTLAALAAIGLIFLVIKIRKIKNAKFIGGHFGEDDT